MSWYGDKPVQVDLGGAFHSRRLKLVSSQVGQVSPSRRPRWSYRRRVEAALALLADARARCAGGRGDRLRGRGRATLPRILGAGRPGLAPVIRYPRA